jgi:hypothetical protein
LVSNSSRLIAWASNSFCARAISVMARPMPPLPPVTAIFMIYSA